MPSTYERQFNLGEWRPKLKLGGYGEYRTRKYDTRNFFYWYNTEGNNLPKGFEAMDILFKLASNGNSVTGWTALTWNGVANIIAANRNVSTTAGAFADGNDWTAGWANFDPENAAY